MREEKERVKPGIHGGSMNYDYKALDNSYHRHKKLLVKKHAKHKALTKAQKKQALDDKRNYHSYP